MTNCGFLQFKKFLLNGQTWYNMCLWHKWDEKCYCLHMHFLRLKAKYWSTGRGLTSPLYCNCNICENNHNTIYFWILACPVFELFADLNIFGDFKKSNTVCSYLTWC